MQELIERVHGNLKKSSVSKFDIYILESQGTEIRVKGADVEKVTASKSVGLAVRVVMDGRLGFAYTTDLSDEGIKITIECAKDNAVHSDPDDYEFSPPLESTLDIELEDKSFEKINFEEKLKLALELEEKIYSEDRRISAVRYVTYSDGKKSVYYVNSNGAYFNYSTTSFTLSALAIAKEGQNAQMGWDWEGERFFKNLNPSLVAAGVAESALLSLGGKPIKSERMPVVFKNTVFAELISVLSQAFLGQNVLRKKSLFTGKLGREIASHVLTLYDDPTQSKGFGSRPYDDEGTPTRKKPVIERGVLKTFLLDLYSASKLAVLKPTGNGIRDSISSPPKSGVTNLVVESGGLDLEDLVSTPEKVLLITEAMGIHTVDPISGDFSIGVSGAYIKDGRYVAPVNGCTVAGNILELLGGVSEVGKDLKWLGNVASPSVLVKSLSVGGT